MESAEKDGLVGHEAAMTKFTNSGIEKRKRGRPKKNLLDTPKKGVDEFGTPRKRGRPRKYPIEDKSQKVKPKRGRPKKYPDNNANQMQEEFKPVETNDKDTDFGDVELIYRKEEQVSEDIRERMNGNKYEYGIQHNDHEVDKQKEFPKVKEFQRNEFEDELIKGYEDQGEMMGESYVQERIYERPETLIPVDYPEVPTPVKVTGSGKKRGRPKKIVSPETQTPEKTPKKRGRPKKSDTQNKQINPMNGIGFDEFLIP